MRSMYRTASTGTETLTITPERRERLLESSTVRRKNLSGDVLGDISKFSSLKYLLVDHNHLSGNISEALTNLSNLTMLDLSANNFSEKISSNLSMIPGLVYFNASGNNLDSEIPPALGSRFNNASSFAEKEQGRKLELTWLRRRPPAPPEGADAASLVLTK
ncbi:hypothetical protein HN51_062863 [Arachis hypogaea]